MVVRKIAAVKFDFLKGTNTVLNSVPDLILLLQTDVMIGNLQYIGTRTGCRGFICTFKNILTNSTVKTITATSTTGKTTGKIMTSADYSSISTEQELKLTIEPYYVLSGKNITYPDELLELSQHFQKIANESLLPQRVFPALSIEPPYSSIMLPKVERFGYNFNESLVNNQDSLAVKFGLKIAGIDLILSDDTKFYFSHSKLAQHMMFDIGAYILDNGGSAAELKAKLYVEDLIIQPFLILYSDTEDEQRIESSSVITHLNTTEDLIWEPPSAAKGQILTYFDLLRFYLYVNKYKFFNNNNKYITLKDINDPVDVRGLVINYDFWDDKVNFINTKVVTPMQTWVGNNIENNLILWQKPNLLFDSGNFFKTTDGIANTHSYMKYKGYTYQYLNTHHHDGKIGYTHKELTGPEKRNNLKRNYYDLLTSASRKEKYITHYYLHTHLHDGQSGYTHKELSKFRYEDITAGRGI